MTTGGDPFLDSLASKPAKDPFLASLAPDAPAEGVGGLAKAAALGFKKGLIPAAVTPEEYRASETPGEAVVDTAFNVLTGIGTATALGAAAGSVLPVAGTTAGAIGGALYGVYSGISNELSRARAEGKDFSLGRAALASALETPVFKSASKLAVAARIAGQVAGTAALEAAYTDDPKRAAGAATFAALTAPLLWVGMRTKPTRATADAVADLFTRKDGQRLAAAAADDMAKAGKAVLQAPEAPPLEFQRWVLRGGELTEADKVQVRLHRRYQRWLANGGREGLADVERGGIPRGALARQFASIRKAADEAGVTLTDLQRPPTIEGFAQLRGKASKQQLDSSWELWNRQKFLAERAAEVGADYAKRAKEPLPDLGLVREWASDAKFVARKVDDHLDLDFEGALDNVSRAKDKADMVSAGYVSRANQLARDAKAQGVKPEDLGKALLGQPPGKPVPQVLVSKYRQLVTDLDDQLAELGLPKTGGLQAAELQGAERQVAAKAGRSLEDTHVDRLLSRQINGTLRAGILDPAVRQVEGIGQALDAAGLKRAARWTDLYTRHVRGETTGVAKWWDANMEQVRRAGLELLETDPTSRGGRALERVPAFLGWLNRQAYPALLGGNVRAAARNMLQGYATTAPELGGAYGYRLVSGGLYDTLKQSKQGLKGLEDTLRAKGQLSGIGAEVAAPAVTGAGRVAQGLDRINELTMLPYKYTDIANRSITMNVGARWAKDLAAGVPAARRALTKASAGLKARLAQAKPEDHADILGDYLIGKTQFRYGVTQQSQLGRHLGSAFSMFTKWPLMVAGDLEEVARHRDVRGAADRLAPLLALLSAKAAIDNNPDEDQFAKYLIGNPVEWSPYASLGQITSGLGGGPLVRTVAGVPEFGAAVLRGSGGEAVRTAVRKGLKTFAPPVSQVLNELDRWADAGGDNATPSRELVNKLTGAEGAQ